MRDSWSHYGPIINLPINQMDISERGCFDFYYPFNHRFKINYSFLMQSLSYSIYPLQTAEETRFPR